MKKISSHSAFTIVELLVVIVVIGILAAITIVAYTGISQKAVASSLQSDLNQASKQLEMFYIDNSVYPNAINDCPTPTSTNLCLKPSGSNQFTDYSPNNTTNPPTYSLAAKNNTTIYTVANNSQPTVLSPAPLNPVADWIATTQGNHYGNFYDLVGKQYATVTRSTPKTIYDPATQRIYDVPANYLAINPRSDGKRGSEAVIEEGRTNYLLNSYFSADTNSDGLSDYFSTYTNGSAVPTTTRVAGAVYGTYAQRFQITSSSDSGKQYGIRAATSSAFVAGDNATTSAWLKGAATGVIVHLRMDIYNGGTLLDIQQATVVPTSQYARYSFTYTNLPVGTNTVYCWFMVDNVDTGDNADISISAFQLEKGAFASSYIPTTTVSVARQRDIVKVPTIGWTPASGTWFVTAAKTGNVSTSPYLFGWTASSTERILMFDSAGGGNMYIAGKSISGDSQSEYKIMTGYSTVAGRATDGTKLNIFVNGIKSSDGAVNYTTPIGLPATAGIGARDDTGTSFWDAPISRFNVYSSALSDSDILSVTNSIKDGP